MHRSADDIAARYQGLAPHWDTWTDGPADRWRKITTQSVLDRAEVDRGDVLLDLGCGTGHIVATLTPHVGQSIGLDLSQGMLDQAKRKAPGARFLRADLREAPEVVGLTTVTLAFTARYLESRERQDLYGRLHRELADDGMVIVGDVIWSLDPDVVDGAEHWRDDDWYPPLPLQLAQDELRRAGFRVRATVLHPAHAVVQALKTG